MVIITSRGIAITIDGTNSQTEKTATGSAMIAPAGGALRYLVFPPTDVNMATGLPYNETVGVDASERQIRVTVREGDRWSDIVLVYHFSTDFDLLRVTPGDSYWPAHRLLELERKLDHTAESCPGRVAPPVMSWSTEEGWTELRTTADS